MREKKPLVNINTTLDLLFGSAEPTLIIKLGLTVCISLPRHRDIGVHYGKAGLPFSLRQHNY